MTVRRWQAIRRRPIPTWREISHRFGNDRDCLGAFLALESAEVLAGDKPANLINIANRDQPCGRNLYDLWVRSGGDVAAAMNLAARPLADRGDSVLLLIYRPDKLEGLIEKPPVRGMLRRLGYPANLSVNRLLDMLRERLSEKGFPHEIGIILGYPLKDVAGFLGWTNLPFSCQGPWKIFGDPGSSLRLAARFRRHRQSMAETLAETADPFRRARTAS